MQDHYPEAAVRHFLDGVILHNAGRRDNAVCHYAFSAECAIKAFNMQILSIYSIQERIGHDITPTWRAITDYYELLGVIDARLSLLIGIVEPPEVLFKKHPGRRYGNDVSYTDAELSACEAFSGRLLQQVIAAAMDGQLGFESERGAL